MSPAPKIVIATFGSLGDLNPFVALARALREAGLRPVIATSAAFRATIESEGLDFAPMRPDIDDVLARLGMEMGEIARRVGASDEFLFRELIFPFLRQSYDDVLAACDGAAAVVAHSIAFGAQAAAERARLPLVNAVLSPVFLMSAHDPPAQAPFVAFPRTRTAIAYNKAVAWSLTQALGLLASPIRRLRREAGLPARSGRALLTNGPYAAGTIALVSPLLVSPQPDHPRDLLIAGHTFHDRFADAAFEPELDAFLEAGPPPVAVTLGSFVAHDNLDLYRASAAAARGLGRRAVLLTAEADRAAARETLLAPDVFVAGYVPHSRLLPRACAVIHHGGVGTTGQALRAGKPQLVIPFFGDQPDNAARVARLGVGRGLARGRRGASLIARELEALLGDEAKAKRASEIGAIVSREDGAATAAAQIAALLNAAAPPSTPRPRASWRSPAARAFAGFRAGPSPRAK